MGSKVFFVTLATCLIANESGVDRHASRVPTPDSIHLGIRYNTQYHQDRN